MNLIHLKTHDGRDVFINPEHIVSIDAGGPGPEATPFCYIILNAVDTGEPGSPCSMTWRIDEPAETLATALAQWGVTILWTR